MRADIVCHPIVRRTAMAKGLYDPIFETYMFDITASLVGSMTAILRCVRIRPRLGKKSVRLSRLQSSAQTYQALRAARCSVCLGCWERLDYHEGNFEDLREIVNPSLSTSQLTSKERWEYQRMIGDAYGHELPRGGSGMLLAV